MAYQDRFNDWESSGVKIVPVLSQPNDNWTGECGYAAFSRAKQMYSPQSTGAVICGQKQMAEEITSALVSDGVSSFEELLKSQLGFILLQRSGYEFIHSIRLCVNCLNL